MAHTCQKCMVRKPSGGFQSMGVGPKSSNQGLGAASAGGSGRVLHRGTRHRGTWVSLEDATIFGKRERDIYNTVYIYIHILYIYKWNSSGFGWVPITVGFRSLCHGPRTKKQPIFQGLCTSTCRCRMVAASLFWDGFDASQVLLPSTGLGNPQAQEVGRFASEEWLG